MSKTSWIGAYSQKAIQVSIDVVANRLLEPVRDMRSLVLAQPTGEFSQRAEQPRLEREPALFPSSFPSHPVPRVQPRDIAGFRASGAALVTAGGKDFWRLRNEP